ncbi:hypothetical protein QPK87_27985 [Kamptonema cortianum]|nr:hypothetical protein [Geitlerinema splendidum]MDK3160368.1 hypothetical protein [Kamptonema cortianum]
MIRVLFVHRQPGSHAARFAHEIAADLESHGMEGVVDDCSAWIPNETGWAVDRKVSAKMREASKGFEIIHAIGLRSAWACGEAFYLRKPWVYTVYDWPKSTHQQVIDRLSSARAGFCSTRAIRRALEDSHAVNLDYISPGIPTPLFTSVDQDSCRLGLGIDEEKLIVLVYPCGQSPRMSATDDLEEELAISGHQAIVYKLEPDDPHADQWLAAADILVVPGEKCGFDPFVAKAMWIGKPVAVRESGGLEEFGVKDVSLLTFQNDDDLAICVGEALHSAVFLSSVGAAARARAHERFDLHDCIRKHVDIYRDLTSR